MPGQRLTQQVGGVLTQGAFARACQIVAQGGAEVRVGAFFNDDFCPLCGRAYDEPPALSRADNQTDICPRCGMMEALAAMPRRETPQDRTRRAVYATGNRWAIENFEATHH